MHYSMRRCLNSKARMKSAMPYSQSGLAARVSMLFSKAYADEVHVCTDRLSMSLQECGYKVL